MVPTCVMSMDEYQLLKDSVFRYPYNPDCNPELIELYSSTPSPSYASPLPPWIELHAPLFCASPSPHDFLLKVAGPLDDLGKVSWLLTHLGGGGVSLLTGCGVG
jgi:hypothetical protein